MRDLYANIRKIRHEKNISQEELSKRTGYATNAMITRIEKGDVDISYSKIISFAEALDVSVPTLLGYSDNDIVDRINKLPPEWQEYMIEQLKFAEYRSSSDSKKND